MNGVNMGSEVELTHPEAESESVMGLYGWTGTSDNQPCDVYFHSIGYN